jgi:hypothetical protein
MQILQHGAAEDEKENLTDELVAAANKPVKDIDIREIGAILARGVDPNAANGEG